MAKADEPPAVKHRDREEKLAAALRANLRRRKAEAGKPAPPGIAEREPDGS